MKFCWRKFRGLNRSAPLRLLPGEVRPPTAASWSWSYGRRRDLANWRPRRAPASGPADSPAQPQGVSIRDPNSLTTKNNSAQSSHPPHDAVVVLAFVLFMPGRGKRQSRNRNDTRYASTMVQCCNATNRKCRNRNHTSEDNNAKRARISEGFLRVRCLCCHTKAARMIARVNIKECTLHFQLKYRVQGTAKFPFTWNSPYK